MHIFGNNYFSERNRYNHYRHTSLIERVTQATSLFNSKKWQCSTPTYTVNKQWTDDDEAQVLEACNTISVLAS